MIPDFNRIAIIAGNRNVTFTDLVKKTCMFSDIAKINPKDKVVIFSENREGWLYSIFSVWYAHGIAVPVDSSSTVGDLAYILKDCEPVKVWTSRKLADTVNAAIAEAGSKACVLLIDEQELDDCDNYTLPFDDITKCGLDNLFSENQEDTSVICYTSGTTGSPKGVMLSFANIMANISAVSSEEVPIFNPSIRTIVLLPLHHVLPLLGTVIAPMVTGGGVAICPSLTGPDIMKTLADAQIGLMIGVPRLWQTIYNGIKNKIDANFVTRFLFWLCSKVDSYKFSRIVFSAVHKKLGGHLETCVSGGAALDKNIARGLKTLGINLLEGYGMTETAPIITFTRPYDLVPGSAGKLLPNMEIKFVDGELCAKGPNVMQGYYNRPEETRQVIDEDGFIHTGDLAHMDEEGRVYITGRCKEIIVLSNGKNVNPTEIEIKLDRNISIVKESAVTPDGDKLCAIIVPQDSIAYDKSDEEIEELVKRQLIEPYNNSTESYKRILRVKIYRGELPRTRMEKIKRFKLGELLTGEVQADKKEENFVEPTFEEYRLIKQFIVNEKKCPVRPTDNIETDLAFDSLDKVSLQSFIELSFGLKITAEKIASFRNVKEMADYVSDYKTRIAIEDVNWSEILSSTDNTVSLPGTWPTASLIIRTLKAFSRAYFGLEAKGVENIPAEGPFIIAPNHQSFFDGAFVAAYLPNKLLRKTYAYAKASHVRHPFVKAVADRNNVIIMDMSNLQESIRQMGSALRNGSNLMIFPEGTRTLDGKLGDFKKTFAILSKELNVPVLPVRISGAYEAMPKGSHWPKRTKITVEYLPTISPMQEETYDELAQRVKQTIEK